MNIDRIWPEDQLERPGRCLACECKDRSLLHDNLTDTTFGVAPGRWTMWKCVNCHAAYLDPRPDGASIGNAYHGYYTHVTTPPEAVKPPRLKDRIRVSIKRHYLNKTYGHQFKHSLPLSPLWHIFRPDAPAWDEDVRHLSAPSKGDRLLDIGCGNGDFLVVAKQIGYEVKGLEPDERAADLCRQRGFNVDIGGLPKTGQLSDCYHHVTLSHVLEHLHDPIGSLSEVYRILRPDGRIWITQPNISAIGHQIFGAAWRGLEAPRHLVLLSIPALKQLLGKIGFVDVQLRSPPPYAKSYFERSLAMQRGLQQDDRTGWDDAWERRAKEADKKAKLDYSVAESLTVTAFKPG